MSTNSRRISRRNFFGGAAAIVGGATVFGLAGTASSPEAAAAAPGALIVASDTNAIVETTAGRVRGFTRNGIFTFKGLPYAADAGGLRRFLPPAKPASWSGIRSSMWYGPTCPQSERTGWRNDENAFLFQWDDGQAGEDCLRANVWTPAVNDGGKRPVMVWLHGGGWTAGSGQEQPAYNGENLSRRGDVVVVSLNHRLNILGYLNLSAFGEKYASSVSVGVLDMVAGLEWVRDNIANFGGDPGNVLIFGQSGGGGKVSTLMSMPMAKGLFHKAVVQSGSTLRIGELAPSEQLGAEVAAQLGLDKASIDKIQTVPYAQLLAAGNAAVRKLQPSPPVGGIGMPTVRSAGPRYGFGPVVDGTAVPRHPFDPDAPDVSADVPMIIGTVLNETSPSMSRPAVESITEEDMRKRAGERYRDKANMVVDVYRRAYPNVKPVELLSRMFSVRTNAVTQAERKAARKKAPAYMYLFAWQTPVLDGRPRAFHCSEIPFVFANTDVSAFATGGTAEARELGGRVSDAWINFARKGDPNHRGLPQWPAFSADAGPVMIFDKVCEVRNDPDRELRKVVTAALT